MTEPLLDALDFVVFNLAKATSAILQHDSYLYWPYLLSSVAIAFVAWRWLGAANDSRGARLLRQLGRLPIH